MGVTAWCAARSTDTIRGGRRGVSMKSHDETILVGSWKLVSWVHEDVETGVRKVLFGEHPTGCLVFTASGRVAAILTGEGRRQPKTLEDRIEAYGTMVAYSG